MNPEIFFLTGFGKSGTTWMMHMLNKKKEVVCKGEGRFVGGFENAYDLIRPQLKRWYKHHALRKFNWVGLDDYIVTINKRNFILDEEIYKRSFDYDVAGIIESIMLYFAKKHIDKNTIIIGDKTPIYLDEDFLKLRKVFPCKRIVAMKRDLKQVFLSRIYGWWIQNSNFLNSEKLRSPHFTERDYLHANNFLNGNEDYIATPATVIKFSKIYHDLYNAVEKDAKENPKRTFVVSFEKAMENTLEVFASILNFLNVPYTYDEIGVIIENYEKGKIKELVGNINSKVDFSNSESYLSGEMIEAMEKIDG